MPTSKQTTSDKFLALTDEQLLALCMYGEARNQGLDGMLAVGSVIVNRVKRGGWFGTGIKGVILKPMQFSCLNENDPNRATLEHIALDFADSLNQLDVLKRCYWIAKGITEGMLSSNVGSCCYYKTRFCNASWAASMRLTVTIGDHEFYADDKAKH